MKKDSGFTLIELAVVVAIAAVLSAIAIPNAISWRNSAAVRAAARAVLADFQDAKMAAIKSANLVTIVFNQTVESRTYSYIVFEDANSNMEFDENASDILVYREWKNFGDVQFDTSEGGGDGLTFATNDDGLPATGFRANGLPINNSNGFGAGTVYIKNSTGKTTNSIVLSRVGSIRIDY